jgi:outer membrane receptor protein involved in Fe transport
MSTRRITVHLLSASLLAGVSALPFAAHAEDAPAGDKTVEELVVTGTAKPQRRFDASYAVNSLSATAIQKLAPKSYADLIGSVPGIHVESTGGEVQNITRLRGLPGDRFGMIVQQDGLPLFPQSDGWFFNSGEGMNRFDLMTQRVEIVRGGPAPVYARGASTIVNNITVTGGPDTQGQAQITLGDIGLYRGDAYQSGAINDNTFYAIGGFLRYSDGYRKNGFANDKGGQIRANIKRELENGWVKVSAQYVNDINVFYLPIPIADPRNPSVSLDPFIDYFTGTMNSPSFRNVNIRYLDQGGTVRSEQRDLANGRHLKFSNFALQYQGEFDGTTVNFNSSLTSGRTGFDALYSTTNPVDGTVFANGQLTAARNAFGPNVARLGYTIAGTNGATVYDPATESGLVMQGQYRGNDADFYAVESELSATRTFDTEFGSHVIKAGVNGAFWGQDAFGVWQNYLMQVKSQPKTLDLAAYSATGAILGYVTENGAIQNAVSLFKANLDAKMIAVYVNDTWAITDQLHLDAGIRSEYYEYTGYQLVTAARPVPGTAVSVNFARGFTGASLPVDLKPKATNWTVGASYDFNDNFGVYGRVSTLNSPALLTTYVTTSPLTPTPPTKARQYELGVKANFSQGYLYATGFYTNFDPLNASFLAFNPQTGASATIPFFGTAVSKGVEVDGLWRPIPMFTLSGTVTYVDPQYRDFTSVTGASAAAILGKQIVREPKIFGHVEPTLTFDLGPDSTLETYVGYEFVGRRYVDVLNTTALPAYSTWKAGATLNRGDWKIQVVGENLTNAKGLTEGNTRTDTLSGQGTRTALYGRPLFGRNFRVILSRKW